MPAQSACMLPITGTSLPSEEARPVQKVSSKLLSPLISNLEMLVL